mgnify:CR=1 FL=1
MNKFLKILKKENGETNMVALILILAVIIALVIIFSEVLTGMFDDIWGSLFEESGDIV